MKQNVQGLYALVTQDKVSIMWLVEGTTESATQNIYLRKYDEATKTYVDDPEVFQKGLDQLSELGTSLETVVNDAVNLRAELYVRDTIASFKDLGVHFERVDTKLGKRLMKKPIVVPLACVNEYKNVRLNLGVEIDEKLYRVSTLIEVRDDDEPDVSVSLRYTNKQIDEQIKMLEQGLLDEQVAEKVQTIVDSSLQKSREAKFRELNEKFDFDVEKMLEGEVDGVNLEVRAEYAEGFSTYYLVAEVVK